MKTKFGFIQSAKNYISDETGEVNLGAEESAPEAPAADLEAASELAGEAEESAELDLVESEESESPEASEEVEIKANSEEELEAEIKEAIKEGADEEEVKSMIRKYNIKVDGQEVEEEIDLDNDEEMIRTLQLAKKSHKTMQEKAELERATSQFLKEMRDNPFQALKQLDPDFDEVAYVNQYVDKILKENEMTPEEKENARIRQEYEQMVAERDRLRQEAEEREQEEKNQVIVAQLKSEISKVLDSDDDLVANDNNISIIAQEMIRAGEDNVQLNPQQALEIAKKRIQKEYNQYSSMFKSTAAQKKFMGDELLGKLREDRTKLVQQQQQVKNAKTNSVIAKKAAEPVGKQVSISDVLAGRADWSDYDENEE